MICCLQIYEKTIGEVEGVIIRNKTEDIVASVTEGAKGEWEIRFPFAAPIVVSTSPTIVEKRLIDFKYPISSRMRKTFGYEIRREDLPWFYYYGEALTCGKKGIFKRNIQCTVFYNKNEVYLLFIVGPSDEFDHYYCLYKDQKTVAIIKRVSEDKTRAVIYYTDSVYEDIALTVAAEEIIAFPHDATETRIDPSAGNYISRYQEELELLDRDFLHLAEESE